VSARSRSRGLGSALATLAATCAAGTALASNQETAKPAERFSCKLVLTIDGSVGDRWEHTRGKDVTVPEASAVVKQQTLWACVFFANCARNAKGAAKVTYHVHIASPDGGDYNDTVNLDGWKLPVRDDAGILLARETFAVSFDPPDALGEYTVEVTSFDEVAHASASDARKIALVEYKPGAKFESTGELRNWIGGYSRSPQPERAIPALLAYAKMTASSRESTFPTATGFFVEVLESNKWLCPLALDAAKDQDALARKEMLRAVVRSGGDASELAAHVDARDQETWTQLTGAPRHDPMRDPIAGREDINELVGRFTAGAKIAPVMRLCDALAPDETGAVASTTVHDARSGIDVPLGKVVSAVASSLIGRIEDPLFKSYCQWIFSADRTDLAVRRELKKALEGGK
jgi:hypothetical protein